MYGGLLGHLIYVYSMVNDQTIRLMHGELLGYVIYVLQSF